MAEAAAAASNLVRVESERRLGDAVERRRDAALLAQLAAAHRHDVRWTRRLRRRVCPPHRRAVHGAAEMDAVETGVAILALAQAAVARGGLDREGADGEVIPVSGDGRRGVEGLCTDREDGGRGGRMDGLWAGGRCTDCPSWRRTARNGTRPHSPRSGRGRSTPRCCRRGSARSRPSP